MLFSCAHCIKTTLITAVLYLPLQEGNTPLHCAARDSAHNVVHTLLDLGADKTARNNVSTVPL